jgi:hypothetical protein
VVGGTVVLDSWSGVDSALGASVSPPVDTSPPVVTTYWYYCTDPAGYFPYVQTCSRPWIPVLPQSVQSAPAPVQ